MTGSPKTITTIVCGTDGSPDAQHAVGYTAELARQLGARVVLVHAIGLLEHMPMDPAVPSYTIGDMAREQLNEAWSAPLRDNQVEHACRAEEGPPLLAIPRVAADVSADLIVVASHGEGASSVLPLGSTAHGIVQLSSTPVLVVPGGTRNT